eukprot:4975355-Amphidinium_carterae.1
MQVLQESSGQLGQVKSVPSLLRLSRNAQIVVPHRENKPDMMISRSFHIERSGLAAVKKEPHVAHWMLDCRQYQPKRSGLRCSSGHF